MLFQRRQHLLMINGRNGLTGEHRQWTQQLAAAFLHLLSYPFHADLITGAKRQFARFSGSEFIGSRPAAGKGFAIRQLRPPDLGFLQQGRGDADIKQGQAVHLCSPLRSASRLPKA